jgi:hypothetical protein
MGFAVLNADQHSVVITMTVHKTLHTFTNNSQLRQSMLPKLVNLNILSRIIRTKQHEISNELGTQTTQTM